MYLLSSDSTRVLIFLLLTWHLYSARHLYSAFQLCILSEVRLLNFLRLVVASYCSYHTAAHSHIEATAAGGFQAEIELPLWIVYNLFWGQPIAWLCFVVLGLVDEGSFRTKHSINFFTVRSHPHTPGRYPGRFTNRLWRNFMEFLCLWGFGEVWSIFRMWAKSLNHLVHPTSSGRYRLARSCVLSFLHLSVLVVCYVFFFQRPGGDTVLRRGFDPFIVETLMEVALVFTIQMLICVEHCLLHHVLHFNRQS